MHSRFNFFIIVFLLFFFPSIAHATPTSIAVVSANAYATETGTKILEQGGTAADAAVAMAFVLAVTEPQNSGLGGGGVFLYYDRAQNSYSFIDYMPQAPLKAKDHDYKPQRKLDDAKREEKTGPLAIAVPGFVMGMEVIKKRFGKLSWDALLDDAIKQANEGFPFSKLLTKNIYAQSERLKELKNFIEFFITPLQGKDARLVQKNLALTLQKIKEGGAETFYNGTLAQAILAEIEEAGSLLTSEDLQTYKAIDTPPRKIFFKDKIIITTNTPGLGGILLEYLLRSATEKDVPINSATYTSFVEGALKDFYEKRFVEKQTAVPVPIPVLGQTTHLAVIDGQGNVAAMTNTLGDFFGSGVILPGTGIVMNSAMADYFYETEEKAQDNIRRQQRPIHFLTPTIVFKDFDPEIVIGTSGGSTIPVNLFHVLYQHLIHKKGLATAIKAPKFYTFPEQKISVYEKGYAKKFLPQKFKFKISESVTTAGNIQAISKNKGSFKVFSDPRGEGVGVVR